MYYRLREGGCIPPTGPLQRSAHAGTAGREDPHPAVGPVPHRAGRRLTDPRDPGPAPAGVWEGASAHRPPRLGRRPHAHSGASADDSGPTGSRRPERAEQGAAAATPTRRARSPLRAFVGPAPPGGPRGSVSAHGCVRRDPPRLADDDRRPGSLLRGGPGEPRPSVRRPRIPRGNPARRLGQHPLRPRARGPRRGQPLRPPDPRGAGGLPPDPRRDRRLRRPRQARHRAGHGRGRRPGRLPRRPHADAPGAGELPGSRRRRVALALRDELEFSPDRLGRRDFTPG